jgi:hypothetical protein
MPMNVAPKGHAVAWTGLALAGVAGFLALALSGCAASGSDKVVAPDDMPDICQDLDFNRDIELRETCGVRTRDYMAYRNIPEHRNLLLPKGGKIIKKGRVLELRLQNTLPAPLPPELAGKIVFDEKLRRTFLKSKLDYCEFFPENSTHNVKIIKLDIPQDTGGEISLCYTVESRPTTAQRNTGYASRLEPLDCADFRQLKSKSMAADDTTGATDTTGTTGTTGDNGLKGTPE